MPNYKLIIEYDGLDFKGWQRQKYTSETIQDQIESALQKLLKEKVTLTGAGRTDAGVSAQNQTANFHYDGKLDVGKITYSLNSILPGSITIKKVSKARDDFHSRYSAKKREYTYYVAIGKRSINREHYHIIHFNPDFKKIDSFLLFIKKQKNFRSLCKNAEDKHDFACKVYEVGYKRYSSKKEIVFYISANRFLHSMVRAIFGCALEISRGRLDPEITKQKIKQGEKIPLYYLPANALFLNKTHY